MSATTQAAPPGGTVSAPPPSAAARSRPGRAASRVETLLTVLALAALLPFFWALAEAPAGRDDRYAEPSIRVGALPEPVLPALCARLGAAAEAPVRERLCRGLRTGGPAQDKAPAGAGLPAGLVQALGRTDEAFLAPLREAQARLGEWRARQREGVGDLLALGHAIDALNAGVQPYVRRHALDAARLRGPLPLRCAQQALGPAGQGAGAGALADPARANAVLLLGGALDGVAATGALAAAALLPAAPAGAPCDAPLAETLADAAALMAQARREQADAAKSAAMRDLLRSAGWQWAGWMLLGLGLVKLSRRLASPAAGVALAFFAWALAAWVGRVPWPLAGDRVFAPAREGWTGLPAGFVLGLLAAALLLELWALRRPRAAAPSPPQVPATRLGYPGLALATGVGWLLLLELSARGHVANRYLALYHQGHLWLGLLVFTVLLMLRQPIGRGLAWGLSVLDEAAGLLARRFQGRGARALLLGLGFAAVLLASALLANLRQLTSELGRVWLIVGAAWFFFLRGGPLAERLAGAPGAAGSLLRYLAPLLLVAAVLGVAMLATRDFGPLLIALYGAGAFVAASVAMWWHQRGGQRGAASLLAAGVFALWIVVLTAGLIRFGGLEATTALRLESLAAPLASANDQLALVRWFQRATPPLGHGIGHVPWCGHAPAGSGCPGVPAQIHSDYTLTALVGVFGPWATAAFALGFAAWLHRLVRHHGRVTRGEPRLVAQGGGRLASEPQAFLSWIAVAWVVLTLCQLAVTVAGNLAVLPLTGVTWPFVSFGLTSLLVNLGFLGLCLNLDLPAGEHRGERHG